MLNPIYKAIGYLLAVAYSVVPAHNLGLAIILLTCVVMLALFPLTAKQARSMISMQKVQPEIKRLQQKYKNDKQKQNEEILKFYQENKINPLAGCLPLVMQFPIFISLFHVLRGVQGNVPKTGPVQPALHRHLRQGLAASGPQVPEAPDRPALPRDGPVEVALERARWEHRLDHPVRHQHPADHRAPVGTRPARRWPASRTTRTPRP